jgi:putative endonuclease
MRWFPDRVWLRWFRRSPKSLGERGEDAVAKFLKRNGFSILERNARLSRYEIDIIAREGDTVAFVEVKTRQSDSIAAPEVNVDFRKRQHIRRAARAYIAQHGDDETYYRFDIASVLLPDGGAPEITLYRNAFPDE